MEAVRNEGSGNELADRVLSARVRVIELTSRPPPSGRAHSSHPGAGTTDPLLPQSPLLQRVSGGSITQSRHHDSTPENSQRQAGIQPDTA